MIPLFIMPSHKDCSKSSQNSDYGPDSRHKMCQHECKAKEDETLDDKSCTGMNIGDGCVIKDHPCAEHDFRVCENSFKSNDCCTYKYRYVRAGGSMQSRGHWGTSIPTVRYTKHSTIV